MSNSILILGDSGTGKSTSFRNLDPKETFVINVINKPLPFRGAKKVYTKLSADGMEGNLYSSDNPSQIRRVIKHVNEKRPEIKNLIVDDFGYTVMNDFMRKCLIKGWDKFSEISKEFSDTIDMIRELREDLFFIAVMHVETDKQGKTKPKTVGNMIDQYICIEGKFTYAFHTMVNDGKYSFITNNDGIHMAKSSMGLFDQPFVDNDLQMIINEIKKFENEDINL